MSKSAARSAGTEPAVGRAGELQFLIASTPAQFEAIHRLNYATFVAEIPQHPDNPQRSLIDRFHADNTYAICLDGAEVVGMIAGRCARPFSLNLKLADLDRHLPPHRKAVEVRLLAVARPYRHSPVFFGLIRLLAEHFLDRGCDLAVISGTVRQLKLYQHLGFRHFGAPVGPAEALFQPMYLTLDALQRAARWLPRQQGRAPQTRRSDGRGGVNLLPGPVALSSAALAAGGEPPISHRDAAFHELLARTRARLAALVSARHALLLVGTGTLANDAVGAQLQCLEGPGLVIANGEFGERLIDHATRWRLRFTTVEHDWGDAYDWPRIEAVASRYGPRWIWAVLCETSTGLRNSGERLRGLCARIGADLCLDATSAVGLFPVDLGGARFATAVSGKGLAGLPGLAAVFHDARLAPSGQVPRYLDLADYEAAQGVPYTHSSNLVAALDRALGSTCWSGKFERVQRATTLLRAQLRGLGLTLVGTDADAAPGIVTLALPPNVRGRALAGALARDGIHIAWGSEYLRQRNWVQLCLMGEFDDATLGLVPQRLAEHLARQVVRVIKN